MAARRQILHPAVRRAAFTWLGAGIIWLALEAFSAAAFPGYSYAKNYISDLGVPLSVGGRGDALGSPRHLAMNVNFIGHGMLFLLGGVFAFRAGAATGRARYTFLGLTIVYAVGSTLVGTFHSSAQTIAVGPVSLHVFGAGLAIIGGNAAIIFAGLNARRLGAANGYAAASATLGTLGLASLAILQAGAPLGLIGLWERGAVYSITLWEIGTGITYLLATRQQGSGEEAQRAIGGAA
ncbi:MAG TPA: DUF998 domain-containing protein [Thermomicrobiales bacterium]|jgi:hypothetical membrane protein